MLLFVGRTSKADEHQRAPHLLIHDQRQPQQIGLLQAVIRFGIRAGILEEHAALPDHLAGERFPPGGIGLGRLRPPDRPGIFDLQALMRLLEQVDGYIIKDKIFAQLDQELLKRTAQISRLRGKLGQSLQVLECGTIHGHDLPPFYD